MWSYVVQKAPCGRGGTGARSINNIQFLIFLLFQTLSLTQHCDYPVPHGRAKNEESLDMGQSRILGHKIWQRSTTYSQ
jgi:hypothetical protein